MLKPKYIVLACRDNKKGRDAERKIRNKVRSVDVEFMKLDLADLNSVKEFAEQVNNKFEKIDILLNNAGLNSNKREKKPNKVLN